MQNLNEEEMPVPNSQKLAEASVISEDKKKVDEAIK
jgi:hypothetical protein